MNSNKKLLSIFGFLGVLVGLIIVNVIFLKISKSVVEYSRSSQKHTFKISNQENLNKGIK